jgi:hypothetical protein
MITDRPWVATLLRLTAYAVGVATIAFATGWGAYRVGLKTLSLLDAKIMDGSGRAGPQPIWTEPPLPQAPDGIAPAVAGDSEATAVLTVGSGRPPVTPPRASTDDPVDDPAAAFHNGASGTYRTYCVRLCDGYYWPISFSTTADRFDDDQDRCNSACGSPARLFVHRIPGGGPGTMVTPDGLPYSALKTAFLFRTKYDAQCKCKSQPWEEASKNRHRHFALLEAARRGDRVAAREAKELAGKMAEEERQSVAQKNTADAEAARELKTIAAKSDLDPPGRSQSRRSEPTVLRLGALPAEPSPRRFTPASGTNRGWKERAFSDN